MTLPQAVACEEGFYDDGPPNRPQRNRNPGDLEWHPWMIQFGSRGGDPRFAVFPSSDEGFAALLHLLQFPLYRGKTVTEFVNTFAPSNENDVGQYVRNLCAFCECTPDTVIDTILA